MTLSEEQIQDILRVGNPTDEERRLIRMGWDAAIARMRTTAAPDGWREGVESAARLIDIKADLYSTRFGHDDMGVLSFGTGTHAEIKMAHYTGLLELADEVRAMLAAAQEAKP